MTGWHVPDSINTKKSRMGDQAAGILIKKNDVSDFVMKPVVEYTIYDDGSATYRVVKRPF